MDTGLRGRPSGAANSAGISKDTTLLVRQVLVDVRKIETPARRKQGNLFDVRFHLTADGQDWLGAFLSVVETCQAQFSCGRATRPGNTL